MKKAVFILVMLTVCLYGCTRINEVQPGRPRFVERITAQYEGEAMRLNRSYTDGKKMQAVLTYLRFLDPLDGAQPQEQVRNHAKITLYYSDGGTKVYEQRNDQYLRVDGGVWKRIKPEQGQELSVLLRMLEGD